MAPYTNNTVEADGINIFYREAGPNDPSTPVILLIHGFPTSSHQYRNLIPALTAGSNNKYRIIAPDLPGFGFTEVPESRKYKYTFENFALSIEALLDVLNVKKYTLYGFDYGAPTGFRMALRRPESIQAIISQNGNAYEEGLGDFWNPLRNYWASGLEEHRAIIRDTLLIYKTHKMQYTLGTPDLTTISPETYTLDDALMLRPGIKDIQLDIFYDYQTNLPLYPKFQEFFKSSKVPILAAWGKHDIIFVSPGAEAFKKDLGDQVELHLLDAGHFAVESHTDVLADLILKFLETNGI
ncbi:alpha/beta-Hydrolase [Glarea lozoyensis ATCC 20868]|uniref:Alpha/beta-Hydrolase n=1 Tax=Glarea lozoyensis (strain ATCC 20868 / MF5171) TaxID=1116229 RepID=S3D042_GLAL2|nr:alpha/beta-Hydrolase [Glarea lozoyensis ATCC 20868]EPE25431.1 alpha/beta-Hydrolase [Glarea lozoyensis ATCC 20868]